MRAQFLERLKDPNIYSLRNDIALMDLYIGRVLGELAHYVPGAEPLPPTPVETSRLTFTEAQVWERVHDALELRVKMIAQEVKTMELMATHSGRQVERAQALNAVVIEVLRTHLAGTTEGRAQLVAIADELEQKVRQLQLEEREGGTTE